MFPGPDTEAPLLVLGIIARFAVCSGAISATAIEPGGTARLDVVVEVPPAGTALAAAPIA